MDRISFHTFATQSAWQQMQSLKQNWDATECTVPTSAEGKGEAYEKIVQIGEEYKLLHEAVSVLLANTLQFLQKTEEAFVGADEKMAEKIGGGEYDKGFFTRGQGDIIQSDR